MAFPERFSNLPEYAFPRLRKLLDVHEPGAEPIAMTIGEPRHAIPDFVGPILAESLAEFGRYPVNEGTPELLGAISDWAARRHGVTLAPERLMAANGTREALFNAVLALCPETKRGRQPVVAMPNPFYQVYAMGAMTTGAQPLYVDATEQTGFLPDFEGLDPDILDRMAIAFLCSPANPQGAVAGRDYLARLLELAERHDFVIFSDECYSELWADTPPPGVLDVAAATGAAPERVVMFNSLSKRSNLAGLRSGFVAAGPQSMTHIRRLRAYAGAPLPLPVQRVSTAAWADETHVETNRALYRAKYDLAQDILGDLPGFRPVEAGFFLWLKVPASIATGEAAALKLWREAGVRVLPGAYLARNSGDANPGNDYIRVALVAPHAETQRGLTRLRACLYG
ncbi:aminotransferase class I/II-fold pyridoxal phosphate-dependent enzyme [Phaeovulum vinaykumarii]|uniref:Aspartate/methionine/tyrosine aminotransferase n=1 Tax=Phaeovulum vinaykumarii TaxID=407234 RepID=A0A1N7KPT7_9RHOB|nr:aminotransferase class I/II-fold pyridoxal phosphate-dependent enzyme [Phaeovulum vinaykumarii]SIS63623.1 Aspartate/methionine/tyrosine aminotransferase [Phaeovulum vinaykumarii]SOC01860.1 aspartate/methionine/tyrosine aminotransferase [Phaeovulum vinaykumarii]